MAERAYQGGRFFIEFGGGKPVGWLHSVEGLGVEAAKVTIGGGPTHLPDYTVGNLEVKEGKAEIGFSMGKEMKEWMKLTLDLKHAYKDGAVIATDHDFVERSRIEFKQALITEIKFPNGDASSKDAARISLSFKPEEAKFTLKKGGVMAGAAEFAKSQKLALVSNFRFELGGLGGKVQKVELGAIKVSTKLDEQGDRRWYDIIPTKTELGDLTVTLPEVYAEKYFQMHQDFVIDGKCDASKELDGALIWLSQDRAKELARINFQGVGMMKYEPDKLEAHGDKLRVAKFTFYIQRYDIAGTEVKA